MKYILVIFIALFSACKTNSTTTTTVNYITDEELNNKVEHDKKSMPDQNFERYQQSTDNARKKK